MAVSQAPPSNASHVSRIAVPALSRPVRGRRVTSNVTARGDPSAPPKAGGGNASSFVSVLDPKLKIQSESFGGASKRVSRSAQAATILFEPGKAAKTDGNLIALDIGLAKTNTEAPERTAALERKLHDEAVERANALTLQLREGPRDTKRRPRGAFRSRAAHTSKRIQENAFVYSMACQHERHCNWFYT